MDQVLDFLGSNRWVMAAAGLMTLIGLFAWLRGLVSPGEQAASRKDIKAVADAIAESRRFAEQTIHAQLAKSTATEEIAGRLAQMQAQMETIAASYQRLAAERLKPERAAEIDVAVTEARTGDTTKAVGILRGLAAGDESRKDPKAAAKTYAQTGALLYYTDARGALDAYTKAVELDPDDLDGWLARGQLYARVSSPFDAKAMFARARDIAKSRGDDKRLALALHAIGQVHRSRGETVDAERLYLEALAVAERSKDRWNMAAANTSLGVIHLFRSEYPQAEQYLSKAAALSDKPAERESLGVVKNNIGLLHLFKGELDAAEKTMREAIAIGEEFGSKDAGVYGNLGMVLHRKNDLAAAEELFLKSLKLATAMSAYAVMANQYFNLAKVLRDQGKNEEACKRMRLARTWFKEAGPRGSVGWADDLLAKWQCPA